VFLDHRAGADAVHGQHHHRAGGGVAAVHLFRVAAKVLHQADAAVDHPVRKAVLRQELQPAHHRQPLAVGPLAQQAAQFLGVLAFHADGGIAHLLVHVVRVPHLDSAVVQPAYHLHPVIVPLALEGGVGRVGRLHPRAVDGDARRARRLQRRRQSTGRANHPRRKGDGGEKAAQRLASYVVAEDDARHAVLAQPRGEAVHVRGTGRRAAAHLHARGCEAQGQHLAGRKQRLRQVEHRLRVGGMRKGVELAEGVRLGEVNEHAAGSVGCSHGGCLSARRALPCLRRGEDPDSVVIDIVRGGAATSSFQSTNAKPRRLLAGAPPGAVETAATTSRRPPAGANEFAAGTTLSPPAGANKFAAGTTLSPPAGANKFAAGTMQSPPARTRRPAGVRRPTHRCVRYRGHP
jgi:hypothetical protein